MRHVGRLCSRCDAEGVLVAGISWRDVADGNLAILADLRAAACVLTICNRYGVVIEARSPLTILAKLKPCSTGASAFPHEVFICLAVAVIVHSIAHLWRFSIEYLLEYLRKVAWFFQDSIFHIALQCVSAIICHKVQHIRGSACLESNDPYINAKCVQLLNHRWSIVVACIVAICNKDYMTRFSLGILRAKIGLDQFKCVRGRRFATRCDCLKARGDLRCSCPRLQVNALCNCAFLRYGLLTPKPRHIVTKKDIIVAFYAWKSELITDMPAPWSAWNPLERLEPTAEQPVTRFGLFYRIYDKPYLCVFSKLRDTVTYCTLQEFPF
jgi:hypothetical protein